MNKVILTGNICKNNELKITPSGKHVITNTIAVERDYKNQDGVKESDFIQFVVFGISADYLSSYAKKGDKIAICGRWNHRSYQDRNGQNRYVDEVLVENVEILIRRNTQEESHFENNDFNQEENNYENSDLKLDIVSDDLPF